MAPDDPAVAEMNRLLRRAAFLWLTANPDPPRPRNSFLLDAESAYFDVVGHPGSPLTQ